MGDYMSLIINENNMQEKDIQSYSSKVRAILIDDDNNLLVANNGNILLFPGGSINKNEEIPMAIVRELKEETGISHLFDELTYLNTLNYYQKNYPMRDGRISNRLVTTHYYIGKYKGISKQTLTENEKKGNFNLELIPIENLEEIVLNRQSNNPRNIYFVNEMLTILSYYKKKYFISLTKKK